MSCSLYAQDSEAKQLFTLPKYSIGISPSAFLNPYPAIQFSQDLQLNEWVGLSLETGYLNINFIKNESNTRDLIGFRIRGGVEFLLSKGYNYSSHIGVFINYRHTEEYKQIQMWHNNYIERLSYLAKGNLYSLGLSFTKINPLSKRIIISRALGIGLGQLKVTTDNKSPLLDVNNNIFIFPQYSNLGHYLYPIVFFNVNVSYRIIN